MGVVGVLINAGKVDVSSAEEAAVDSCLVSNFLHRLSGAETTLLRSLLAPNPGNAFHLLPVACPHRQVRKSSDCTEAGTGVHTFTLLL